MDQNEQRNELDRISSLHDSILHHILSFLPTKYVVRTSLLSQRWQNLWLSVPDLHFVSEKDKLPSFRNLMNGVLSRRDKSLPLLKFRFVNGHYLIHCKDLEMLIMAALRAGTRELDIYNPYYIFGRHISIPICFPRSNSLVDLKLHFLNFLRFPESFCLPNLKSLSFFSIIVGEGFCQQLLSSRNLEIVLLENCRILRDKPRSLDQNQCSGVLSKLKKASIGMFVLRERYKEDEDEDEDIRESLIASRFLRFLSNAEHLVVHDYGFWLLKAITRINNGRQLKASLPTFGNAKHLEVSLLSNNGDDRGLAFLLRRSPSLQSLSLRFLDDPYGSNSSTPLSSFTDVPQSLKRVSLYGYLGIRKQPMLLSLFMGFEFVEKTTVELHEIFLYPNFFRRELQHLVIPRSSTKCSVYVR